MPLVALRNKRRNSVLLHPATFWSFENCHVRDRGSDSSWAGFIISVVQFLAASSVSSVDDRGSLHVNDSR